MRLQLANPTEHGDVVNWPLAQRLADWDLPSMHEVLGLHRHVVRMVETDEATYVVKELPDDLAEREYRLLRSLAEHELPTAKVVGVVTSRDDRADGLLITRHIDYSLPYRVLLRARLADPLSRRAAARRVGGAAGPVAPRRVLLG